MAGAPQSSHVRQYNLILAFPSYFLFHFCLLLWGFLLYEDILKSTAKPLVDAQHCVRSITNSFSRQCLAHRHASEPLNSTNSAGMTMEAVRISVDKQTHPLSISDWSQAEGKKRKEEEPRQRREQRGEKEGRKKKREVRICSGLGRTLTG